MIYIRQICFGIKLLRNTCTWAALLDHELVGKHSAHRKYGKSMPMVASTAKEKRSTNQCALSELAVSALTTVKLVPALLQLARLGYIDEALELTEALASALPPRFDSFRRRRHHEEGGLSTSWEIAIRSDDTQTALTRLLSVFEGAAPAVLSQRDMGACDCKGLDARWQMRREGDVHDGRTQHAGIFSTADGVENGSSIASFWGVGQLC